VLTRLHVQGFKNLLDVDVRLGPFNCFTGHNAVGKSNLFDAIRFLHLLTQHPIMEAVALLRESKGRSPHPRSLFTAFGSFVAPEVRFRVDLLVERSVQDDFGVAAKASISSLRYEVAFRLITEDGVERLELIDENLLPINLEIARKELGFPAGREFKISAVDGRRSTKFVSTEHKESGPLIRVHQEGHGGRTVSAPKSSRTIVGGTASSDFPTILAAHREMESWRTLLLEPSAMRAASAYADSRYIDSRGAYLPGTIERLRRAETTHGQVYATLANRLAELIDDIHELRIRDDRRTETLTLEVRGKDGVFHPAGSLSDGTLRFLVLATLALDPSARGVMCLEEPENGIHPDRIGDMIGLLKDIAVDPHRRIDEDNPLRQVLVNTHSPVVVQNVHPQDVIYLDEERIVRNGSAGKVAALRVPAGTWRSKSEILHLAPGQIQPYFPEQHELWDEFVEH